MRKQACGSDYICRLHSLDLADIWFLPAWSCYQTHLASINAAYIFTNALQVKGYLQKYHPLCFSLNLCPRFGNDMYLQANELADGQTDTLAFVLCATVHKENINPKRHHAKSL